MFFFSEIQAGLKWVGVGRGRGEGMGENLFFQNPATSGVDLSEFSHSRRQEKQWLKCLKSKAAI